MNDEIEIRSCKNHTNTHCLTARERKQKQPVDTHPHQIFHSIRFENLLLLNVSILFYFSGSTFYLLNHCTSCDFHLSVSIFADHILFSILSPSNIFTAPYIALQFLLCRFAKTSEGHPNSDTAQKEMALHEIDIRLDDDVYGCGCGAAPKINVTRIFGFGAVKMLASISELSSGEVVVRLLNNLEKEAEQRAKAKPRLFEFCSKI